MGPLIGLLALLIGSLAVSFRFGDAIEAAALDAWSAISRSRDRNSRNPETSGR